jgi:hypothetical protein
MGVSERLGHLWLADVTTVLAAEPSIAEDAPKDCNASVAAVSGMTCA